jgi:hypothetical protein
MPDGEARLFKVCWANLGWIGLTITAEIAATDFVRAIEHWIFGIRI